MVVRTSGSRRVLEVKVGVCRHATSVSENMVTVNRGSTACDDARASPCGPPRCRAEVRYAIAPTVMSSARRAAAAAAATKSSSRPDSRWATKARNTWSGWASTTGT